MPIISFTTDVAGQINVNPRRIKIISTDSLATVTAAGYLNQLKSEGFALYPTDIIDMVYLFNTSTGVGTYGEFLPTISGAGVITLAQFVSPGDVTLPVVDGDFANFDGTTGKIKDGGFSPSDATKTKVVMAGSATVANVLAHFIDTAGTIDDTAANVTNLGNISAGASGTAGTLSSFPATAANGSLVLSALNAGGNFTTTIRNSVMGQSTVYSLGDIGAATGGIPVATSVFIMKSVAGAAAAGGAAAQSFTDAFCTSGSNVIGNWNTQANAASVLKIVPGNGSFVVTSSADAGVGTFNYIITK